MILAVTVKPHTRGTRPHQRRVWRGTLDGQRLTAKRGCYRRVVDKQGAFVSDEREPSRPLVCNIGDRLLLSHHDVLVDEIAIVEVVGITPDGWVETLTVRRLAGCVAWSTRDVWVQDAKGLR